MKKALSSWILVAALASAAGIGTNAAGPANDRVFRSSVELVALNVIVTDARQHFVRNLQERDFVVLEDGVQQDISFFAGGQLPLDLILLIDTSSSMGITRPIVQKAASGFLRVLRPEDRGAVLGFTRGVRVLQDLTNDVPALRGAVARAGAYGETSLYTALFITLRQFGKPVQHANQARRQAIVVLTDGEENTSGISYDDLLDEARCHGVAIYAIMLQSDELQQREQIEGRLRPARRAMKELARETGALAYFPKVAAELSGVYETIAAELTNQYSIAYTPRAATRNRALRQVSIRVSSQPALLTRTRINYVSSGPSLKMALVR
ncbi:MAG: VWA domain-containing protein [Acidobacteriota bacterium]